MLENITRMFGENDPDSEDESEDWIEEEQPVESSSSLNDGGEQNADEPDVSELDVRLDELDDELESTQSSLRALRSSQEEMADSIEEVNDTVRQLVGVYDRLAAEENPFIDDPAEMADDDTESPMPEVEGSESTSSTPDDDFPNDWTTARESAIDQKDDEQTVVSFEDLRAQTEGELSGGDGHQVDASTGDESSNGDGTNPVVGRDGEGVPASTQMVAADGTPVLASVPEGYAGDVLVMELLATLMDRSGPAGALRAVNHYENIGWISPEVKERFVDIIGGPALDVFVDPTQPREPTADEHEVSHDYLRVLNQLKEI
ncbi:MAG: archaellum component FlaD/FlaE [Natronomonas sp.]|jgi:archaellum component FlaD/FlaE